MNANAKEIQALRNLGKTFPNSALRKYTGQQIHQVIREAIRFYEAEDRYSKLEKKQLVILGLFLDGERSVTLREIGEAIGMKSPGQISHHVNSLISNGHLKQTARSTYKLAVMTDLVRPKGERDV